MNNTIKSLEANQNICIIGGYFRVKGSVEIFDSGKYFDICTDNNPDYKVNNAILISINEAFDLDKVTPIE
jgi:hypothetical protein